MRLRLQRYSYRFAEQVDDNNRIIRTEYFTSHPLHLNPQRAKRKAKEKDSALISKPNKIETHLRRLGRQRATSIVQFTFSELKWVR